MRVADVGRDWKIGVPVFEVYWINRECRCGCYPEQRIVRGLDPAILEYVVVEVGSPYSESHVDWMLHCWSVSWSKRVLAAWSRRVERT